MKKYGLSLLVILLATFAVAEPVIGPDGSWHPDWPASYENRINPPKAWLIKRGFRHATAHDFADRDSALAAATAKLAAKDEAERNKGQAKKAAGKLLDAKPKNYADFIEAFTIWKGTEE